MGEIRSCLVCGKEFEAVNHGPRRYCSRECRYKMTGRVVRTCQICGKEFITLKNNVMNGNGKYCSIDCYTKAQSKKVECTCKTCGKKFLSVPSRIADGGGKYCSLECFGKMVSGPNHYAWNGGSSFGKYCELFNANFKKRVRAFFNNTCVVCGKTEQENGRKLSVHHVHYDKESCCGNAPRLFVLLCTRCHSSSNANRDKWIPFFTDLIHTKYNGKCYYTKEEYCKL